MRSVYRLLMVLHMYLGYARLYANSCALCVSCELNVYLVQGELSEEEKAVLEDEALSTPDFVSELRQEFVENLNALKALSAHGPV